MARYKNAITEYEIKPVGETPGDAMRLAKYIQTVDSAANDETEEQGYYDGDGTATTDVVSSRYTHTFTGFRFYGDKAQDYICGLKHKVGDERLVTFTKTGPDGTVEEGIATVSDITDGGGDATDYGAFSCTIAWNEIPEVIPGEVGAG